MKKATAGLSAFRRDDKSKQTAKATSSFFDESKRMGRPGLFQIARLLGRGGVVALCCGFGEL